ncbi:MAG: hypothetical protein KGL48_05270 [Sphingomonadales bacterium]|nr:hypothetical protein [Sphingomonadales bacterium]MDE2570080.1 hypothetical protein [Sphingomonadales bacterium]
MIAAWTCPGPAGPSREYALAIDRQRPLRLLVVPALFEEANRTRRMLAEMMRRLDAAEIDSFLPDLPGCNESTQDFATQSLSAWRGAMEAAAREFAATHVLAIRGGALVPPDRLPGVVYEPLKGQSILRQLIRARILASREAGRQEEGKGLVAEGKEHGLELAGYRCGALLIAGLESAVAQDEGRRVVCQAELPGAGLWLRSEPGESPGQSEALAKIIAAEIGA